MPGFSSSYLYKVAYSALVDEIRRVRRRRETDLEDEGVAPSSGHRRKTPSVLRPRGKLVGESRTCLAQMKRERRLAVTLHLQGHSVRDAARILEWAEKRTENLVYRGLSDLRACLMSKGIRP